MNRVSGAQKYLARESSKQFGRPAENPIGHRNQRPDSFVDVIKKARAPFLKKVGPIQTFAKTPVENAADLGDGKRRSAGRRVFCNQFPDGPRFWLIQIDFG